MNTVTFYIAMTLVGRSTLPRIYDPPQEACAAAKKAWFTQVERVTYDPMTMVECCEEKYGTMGFQQACKKDPDQWTCERPSHTVTLMNCVSSPSYKVESAESAE